MKRLLIPLLFLTATVAKAQTFGGNPPSIKWKQVNTKSARVIFPEGMDSTGIKVAEIIRWMYPAVQPSIGYKQKQVSIVLQNQTTISNAYVGLAPFRSEFYLTPSQNSFELGSLYWPGQLAIHEFRHVQQYNNFNVGLSHVLKILFGEGGQALGNDLSVPNWFFEGDAVFNETLVSRQGRGRLPYFFNDYRALWAAGKSYSWMKLRNGSYKDLTPNHYPLGYMMVAYGREQYGAGFWRKVTHDAAAYNTGFYPLQNALKKYAGVTYTSFRNSALDHFKKEFKDDKQVITYKKNQHFIANQEYPAYINDSTLIYLKTTYNHIPQFIIRTGNTEKAIAVQGITTDNYFNYHNGKLVYAGYRPDLRWGYRNYNELRVLDINTGEERRITRKTKYFSPAFSDDGKNIVAVDVDPSGKSTLHILDAESGKVVKVLPNPAGLFYTFPKFIGDDGIISAVRNRDGKMTLAKTNISTGATDYLLPFSYEPIAFTQVQENLVYFTQTSGLNDLLYTYDLKNQKLTRINADSQNGAIGFYQPAIASNKIAWTGLTAFGWQLNEAKKENVQIVPATAGAQLSDFGIASLEKDSAANLLASVTSTPLAVTKYSKAHGLFNFHSIFPNINDPNYSLELAGENVLNTFQSRLSVNYNRDEGYKRFGYDAIYGSLFPYLSAGANYTLDRRGFSKGRSIYFNETDLHAGFDIPLNFSAGKNYTSLTAGSDIYYSQRRFQEPFRNEFKDRHYTYLNNSISFSNQIQQAKQQINPRFAQSVYVNYKTTIAGLSAAQFLVTGTLYLPGLSANHSLVVSGSHQQKGKDDGLGFSNDFPFSKGYTAENLDNMNKVSLSYHFPIAYPDAGFGNLVYLLRLRGYLFYDHTHATDAGYLVNGKPFNQNFRSAGGAVFFDTKLFNSGSVSFGIRYSHLLDPDLFGGNGKNRIELILPVSLF